MVDKLTENYFEILSDFLTLIVLELLKLREVIRMLDF